MSNWKTSAPSNVGWEKLLPSPDQDVHKEHLDLFLLTMQERQNIWYKKEMLKQKPPWSDDDILRDYKFTNVFRELDRNSQWEIKHIIQNPELDEFETMWQICFFRLMNNPPTFEYFAQETDWQYGLPKHNEFDADLYYDLITEFREAGNNPYTSAYLVNTLACPGKKRDWCFANVIMPSLHDNILKIYHDIQETKIPQEVVSILTQLPAVADFIANEMYVSFNYAPRYSDKELMKWTEDDWTNVGPGCSLGLRLIYPSIKGSKQQEEKLIEIRDETREFVKRNHFWLFNYDKDTGVYHTYNTKIDRLIDKKITLHTVEMWLCEFSKYWKMMHGVGKQRSKYQPKVR